MQYAKIPTRRIIIVSICFCVVTAAIKIAGEVSRCGRKRREKKGKNIKTTLMPDESAGIIFQKFISVTQTNRDELYSIPARPRFVRSYTTLGYNIDERASNCSIRYRISIGSGRIQVSSIIQTLQKLNLYTRYDTRTWLHLWRFCTAQTDVYFKLQEKHLSRAIYV